MKEQFTTLLQTPMDRRSFLKYMAVAGVMTMGGGVLIQSITGLTTRKPATATHTASAFGYGSSVYGGERG